MIDLIVSELEGILARLRELQIKSAEEKTTLEILPGTAYAKYALPLDYTPSRDYNPRYGYSREVIPELDRWFASYLPKFADFYAFMRSVDVSRIPVQYGGGVIPSWIGGPICAFDSLALYSMIARHAPKIYLEIGSGMTTMFARQAVSDFNLMTRIISIDPTPRRDIDEICDDVIREGLEIGDFDIFEKLNPGDILFFDGSHRCFMNSDVTVFFIDILPRIKPGVIIHVHDIMLPYDYPDSFKHWYWNEQYMLAVYMMAGMEKLEPLLPTAWMCRSPLMGINTAQPVVDLGSVQANKSWHGGGSMWFTKLT